MHKTYVDRNQTSEKASNNFFNDRKCATELARQYTLEN